MPEDPEIAAACPAIRTVGFVPSLIGAENARGPAGWVPDPPGIRCFVQIPLIRSVARTAATPTLALPS